MSKSPKVVPFLVVYRPKCCTYQGVSKSFRTGRLERELQMVQFSATGCSCIAIFCVSLVSFAAITLCVASQRLIPKVSIYFVTTQSGNFWIHPHISVPLIYVTCSVHLTFLQVIMRTIFGKEHKLR
jgi:hypothetical protein